MRFEITGIVTLAAVGLLGVVVLLFPESVANGIAEITQWVVSAAGRWVLWLCSAAVLLSILLVVGPWGRRRLGGSDGQPEFSLVAWLAMLFAAGMGSGLVFWGLAEPLSHYALEPAVGLGSDSAASSNGRASQALALTFLHWGVHAWAVYAVAGLAFACLGSTVTAQVGSAKTNTQSGRASSAVKRSELGHGEALIASLTGADVGARGTRIWGRLFDLVALLAVLFGVAGSLANGVDLLQVGLTAQGGESIPGWLLLLVLGTLSLVSAGSGLRRGIRVLSLFNMALALTLMIWLWLVIDWRTVLSLLMDSVWLYLKALPSWSIRLIADADAGTDWAEGWTVVYLLWWIAWTPFVGIFLAGISRGRSVRQYLVGVIGVPVVVSLLWFGAFGGGGLAFEQANPGALTAALGEHYTAPLFVWYSQLPGGSVLAWGSLLTLSVFLVTSADSATWVMRRLAGAWLPAVPWVWGLLMLLMGFALVLRGEVDVNKQVAIAGAIPFSFVLVLQITALVRWLLIGGGSSQGGGRSKLGVRAKTPVD
ncbi:MAG: BCCT family transporter [Lysobacterales bacterium]